MDWLYHTTDRAVEQAILGELSIEEPWKLVEHFSTLRRDSGTEDERKAAEYIIARLRSWGVRTEVYEPEIFISVPHSASLKLKAPQEREIRCKTPAFSISTGDQAVTGEVIYVPAGAAGRGRILFDVEPERVDVTVSGKIVLTEGTFAPQRIWQFQSQGAKGVIFANPGLGIHEGIVTTIWGAPTLKSIGRKPNLPVVCVNKPDGESLKQLCENDSLSVEIKTDLFEGWKKCLVPVAHIDGAVEPDLFVLVHGHYDSWHIGIGDNATGNATCLELARVFHKHREKLARSMRIAWWPGHSTGRYAGSTWYTDTFAIELRNRCIAQVDIDSPGCKWATAYKEVMWMKEAEDFCKEAIRDAVGQEARGIRPPRAGDYSFNSIGLTSFYMLLSNIPEELRAEKGFYPVGGCGGNIAWHTEDDILDVADKEILMNDLNVYVTSLTRVVNAPIFPFDFTKETDSLLGVVADYQKAGGKAFDLTPVSDELKSLKSSLENFYEKAEKAYNRLKGNDQKAILQAMRPLNQCLMELGRFLIPLDYSEGERYEHDPAVPIPSLPNLAPVKELASFSPEEDRFKFLSTQLVRARNRAVETIQIARREVERISLT
ncbi:MAG: M28 family peptidase [Candidatus Tectomicrobia bacterium]|nr:M28 family peptidase [Candidatus Tectomicrobia bacterium]